MTSGSVLWPATPGDPMLAGFIATELDTYVRLLAEDADRRATAATEAACAELLATMEGTK